MSDDARTDEDLISNMEREIVRLRAELDRTRRVAQEFSELEEELSDVRAELVGTRAELDRHRVAGDELDQLWTDAEIHGLTPGIEEQMRAASDRWRSVRGDAPAAGAGGSL